MRDQQYLFVYGTLRRAHGSLMSKWLARNVEFSGLGTYRGKLLNLGRYPGAIPSRDASDKVVGDIYTLPAGTGILPVLDEYEGKEFCRKKATISLKNGKNVTAWIYIFCGPVSGLPVIRGGNYLKLLKSSREC
jgi:gamma-glutamylcyclotransferase (GGCT)/AIG2-like uncharacterized protein YtfP